MRPLPLRVIAILWVALSVAACRSAPQTPEARALAFIAAARSPAGIDASFPDEDLVERVRCLQIVRRSALDTLDRKTLLDALAGEAGPDKQYPVAERARAQRERATRGVRAAVAGSCRAHVDDTGRQSRIDELTAPIEGAPPEVEVAESQLRRMLAASHLVRIDCETGHLGVLLAERKAELRVADVFPIGFSNFIPNPNDPNMR